MTTAQGNPYACGFLMSWNVSLRIRRVAVKNPFASVPASKTGLGESARTCLGIVTSRKRGIEENRMPPVRPGCVGIP